MRSEALRRMAEEMAALKRSSASPDAKEYFARRERECLDEAREEEGRSQQVEAESPANLLQPVGPSRTSHELVCQIVRLEPPDGGVRPQRALGGRTALIPCLDRRSPISPGARTYRW